MTSDTHGHILFGRTSGTAIGTYREPEYGRGGGGSWFSPLTNNNLNTNLHTHTHSISNTMGGVSGDGTPALSAPQGANVNITNKYYVLAYIMKL